MVADGVGSAFGMGFQSELGTHALREATKSAGAILDPEAVLPSVVVNA